MKGQTVILDEGQVLVQIEKPRTTFLCRLIGHKFCLTNVSDGRNKVFCSRCGYVEWV